LIFVFLTQLRTRLALGLDSPSDPFRACTPRSGLNAFALCCGDKGGEAFKRSGLICRPQNTSIQRHADDVVAGHVFFSLSLSKQCQHI
jgi:hypothetical protein